MCELNIEIYLCQPHASNICARYHIARQPTPYYPSLPALVGLVAGVNLNVKRDVGVWQQNDYIDTRKMIEGSREFEQVFNIGINNNAEMSRILVIVLRNRSNCDQCT